MRRDFIKLLEDSLGLEDHQPDDLPQSSFDAAIEASSFGIGRAKLAKGEDLSEDSIEYAESHASEDPAPDPITLSIKNFVEDILVNTPSVHQEVDIADRELPGQSHALNTELFFEADSMPGHDDARGGNGGGKGGGGGGGGGGGDTPAGEAIDLFAVILHEIGHSIGLPHSDPGDGVSQVMDPFYNGPIGGLSSQDIADVNALYPETGSSGATNLWSDLDGDGIITITYSFTRDNARMEPGAKNTLHKTLNNAFGSEDTWKQIFTDAFSEWEDASRVDNNADGDSVNNVELQFVEVSGSNKSFNYLGEPQDDPASGDIRIAMHKFDGALGVLAHAYYPPPNGSTAAGDLHLDKDENWQDLSSSLRADSSSALVAISSEDEYGLS